jgi:hypothetical protein
VPLPKSTSKPQVWLPFATRYNVVLWFWPKLQQEADQREHTGDELGPKEHPSRGSFFVCLSRLSLNQDKLPVLPHA